MSNQDKQGQEATTYSIPITLNATYGIVDRTLYPTLPGIEGTLLLSDNEAQYLLCIQKGACSRSNTFRSCGHTSCLRHTVRTTKERKLPNGYVTMCYTCAYDEAYFEEEEGYFDKDGHFIEISA